MQLYSHQSEALPEIRSSLKKSRTALIVAPPGFGKTVLASFFTYMSNQNDKNVWFVCHRKELLNQTRLTFENFDIDSGVVLSGSPMEPQKLAQVCSIGSIKSRAKHLQQPDVIIFDECHHINAKSWAAIWDMYPKALKIGLTATPVRSGREQLDHFFTHVIETKPVSWLVENNYLSQYKLYVPFIPDRSGIKTKKTGDYSKSDAESISISTKSAVDNWMKYAPGKLTICYESSVERSLALAAEFSRRGISAAHIDADTPTAVRAEICRKFADREYLVLSNVDLFGEGYDLGAQAQRDITIEAGLFCRPTASFSLWVQQSMRPMRKKNFAAILLDCAGNTMAFQWQPTTEVQWDIATKPKGQSSAPELKGPSLSNCTKCFRIKTHKICEHCGFEPPAPEKSKGQNIDLVEFSSISNLVSKKPDRLTKKKPLEKIYGVKTISELRKIQKERGYKPYWVQFRYHSTMKTELKKYFDGKKHELVKLYNSQQEKSNDYTPTTEELQKFAQVSQLKCNSFEQRSKKK